MAEKKPIVRDAVGLAEMTAADTIPVANIPALTSSGISDFTEAAQDAVGAMVADTNTIDITYTDGTPELKADARTQMSITSDASGLKLSGDEASPGNSQYYGTDSGGTKGFFDLPSGASGETYTAGEAIGAGDLVYVSASGTVMKADANTSTKAAQGFAPSAISNGQPGTIIFHTGKITGLTGLTANAFYYLSNSTTGAFALHSSLTYATGDIQQKVGIAESTTVLRFSVGETILVA